MSPATDALTSEGKSSSISKASSSLPELEIVHFRVLGSVPAAKTSCERSLSSTSTMYVFGTVR